MEDNCSLDNMSVANPVLCLNIPRGGGSRGMKGKNGTHCFKFIFDCFFIYLQQFFWDNNLRLNHQWSEQKQKLKYLGDHIIFFLSQETTVFSYISVVRSKYHFFLIIITFSMCKEWKYAQNSLKFVFGNL